VPDSRNMKIDIKSDYYRVAVRLLGNALRFRYARLTGAPLKPAVVSLAVTNRCNSHCIMCNIWKRAREQPEIKSLEMSRDEIIDLLSRPLFSELVELDLTGGEPHLRDDLVDIVLGVASLQKSSLPRLRSIIVTSNGLLPRQVVSNNQRILEGLKGTHIDLVNVASMDGIGETHDLIRGTSGAYELATETINGLLELRKKYPNYYIGIKTTILPQNINMLDAILDYALERGLFHIISPVFFTETRFRNTDKIDELTPGPDEYKEVQRFFNRDELNTGYFYPLARSFLATGRKRWACTAFYNYLFIDFDGTVYPCELISEPMGNVREQDVADIWNGARARQWRKRSGKLECCRTCNEPGAMRYSACAEGLSYLRFLLKLGRQKFGETLYGEGFYKYFGDFPAKK
jgi:MoaA/NifB/PqqE/SkfB family radical SAM enzyme